MQGRLLFICQQNDELFDQMGRRSSDHYRRDQPSQNLEHRQDREFSFLLFA
jgi:hypothetical protein